MHIYIP